MEPQKLRTCVVVSNDIANEFGAAVTNALVRALEDDVEAVRLAAIFGLGLLVESRLGPWITRMRLGRS